MWWRWQNTEILLRQCDWRAHHAFVCFGNARKHEDLTWCVEDENTPWKLHHSLLDRSRLFVGTHFSITSMHPVSSTTNARKSRKSEMSESQERALVSESEKSKLVFSENGINLLDTRIPQVSVWRHTRELKILKENIKGLSGMELGRNGGLKSETKIRHFMPLRFSCVDEFEDHVSSACKRTRRNPQ